MCESEQTKGRSIIAVSVLSDELQIRPVLPATGSTHCITHPLPVARWQFKSVAIPSEKRPHYQTYAVIWSNLHGLCTVYPWA